MLSDDKFLQKLGKRIDKLVTERFDNQTEFSIAAGVDPRTLRRIVRTEQNPTILVLRKIARALNISLSELVDVD